MRIQEALDGLEELRRRGPGLDVFRREARVILNAVWLNAYEEGKDGVFKPPAAAESKPEPKSEGTHTTLYEWRPGDTEPTELSEWRP